MSELSISVRERSMKAHTRILKMREVRGTGVKIAKELNISEGSVSEIFNDKLTQNAIEVLYALGFKIVPSTHVCVEQSLYQALINTHRRAMANEEMAQQLFMGEE